MDIRFMHKPTACMATTILIISMVQMPWNLNVCEANIRIKRPKQPILKVPGKLMHSVVIGIQRVSNATWAGYPVTEEEIYQPCHVKIPIAYPVSHHGVAYRDYKDDQVKVATFGTHGPETVLFKDFSERVYGLDVRRVRHKWRQFSEPVLRTRIEKYLRQYAGKRVAWGPRLATDPNCETFANHIMDGIPRSTERWVILGILGTSVMGILF